MHSENSAMVRNFNPDGLVEIIAELAAQVRIGREAGSVEVPR